MRIIILVAILSGVAFGAYTVGWNTGISTVNIAQEQEIYQLKYDGRKCTSRLNVANVDLVAQKRNHDLTMEAVINLCVGVAE